MIGGGLFRVAVIASILTAASRAGAACPSGRCPAATAVENVRTLLALGGAEPDDRPPR